MQKSEVELEEMRDLEDQVERSEVEDEITEDTSKADNESSRKRRKYRWMTSSKFV